MMSARTTITAATTPMIRPVSGPSFPSPSSDVEPMEERLASAEVELPASELVITSETDLLSTDCLLLSGDPDVEESESCSSLSPANGSEGSSLPSSASPSEPDSSSSGTEPASLLLAPFPPSSSERTRC